MEGSEAFMPDDHSISDSTSTWGVVDVDAADSLDPTEDLRMASSKLPWAICEYLCPWMKRIHLILD